MTRVDQLREAMERRKAEKEKYTYACGMCPSCYQKSACPGGSDGTRCENYLSPEPTKHEWTKIYRQALLDLERPCDTHTQVHRIGRVNAVKDAMLRIHGYTPEEIRRIEDDLHTTA